ncbi:hypothetical protein HDU76_007146 [Blyttiomyces sp. JEL0837]|nr:hypothetical protein HDU76_007146 [Blyttiomyces sp. JEL0837]
MDSNVNENMSIQPALSSVSLPEVISDRIDKYTEAQKASMREMNVLDDISAKFKMFCEEGGNFLQGLRDRDITTDESTKVHEYRSRLNEWNLEFDRALNRVAFRRAEENQTYNDVEEVGRTLAGVQSLEFWRGVNTRTGMAVGGGEGGDKQNSGSMMKVLKDIVVQEDLEETQNEKRVDVEATADIPILNSSQDSVNKKKKVTFRDYNLEEVFEFTDEVDYKEEAGREQFSGDDGATVKRNTDSTLTQQVMKQTTDYTALVNQTASTQADLTPNQRDSVEVNNEVNLVPKVNNGKRNRRRAARKSGKSGVGSPNPSTSITSSTIPINTITSTKMSNLPSNSKANSAHTPATIIGQSDHHIRPHVEMEVEKL